MKRLTAERRSRLDRAREGPIRLQGILNAFRENLYEVEEIYAEVGALIDEHAGFDADGGGG